MVRLVPQKASFDQELKDSLMARKGTGIISGGASRSLPESLTSSVSSIASTSSASSAPAATTTAARDMKHSSSSGLESSWLSYLVPGNRCRVTRNGVKLPVVVKSAALMQPWSMGVQTSCGGTVMMSKGSNNMGSNMACTGRKHSCHHHQNKQVAAAQAFLSDNRLEPVERRAA